MTRFRQRYVVYIAASVLSALIGALNSSMTLGWVCMVKGPNTTVPTGSYPQLNWTHMEQQFIFSSDGIGALIMAVPGGWFVSRYGSRLAGALALAGASITTLLIPVTAEYSFVIVVVLRAFVGMATTIFGPLVLNICSWWAPRQEAGLALSIVQTGVQIGRLLQMVIGGTECQTIGWQWLFYISGICGFSYSLLWGLFYRDDPHYVASLHPEELEHIVDHRLRKKREHGKIPWIGILTNAAVWSCFVCRFSLSTVQRGISQFIPTYMREILHFETSANGLFSALPIVMQILGRVLAGPISDIRLGSILTRMKLINTFSFLGAAGCALGLSFIQQDTPPAVPIALLSMTMFMTTFTTGGFNKSNLFIAAEYSPVTASIMNLSGAIGTLIMPFIVDSLTVGQTLTEWSYVFYVVCAFTVLGALIFLLFGSDKRQRFADQHLEDEEKQVTTPTYGSTDAVQTVK